MVHEFNPNSIRFSSGSNIAAATKVTQHNPETIAAISKNSTERNDPHGFAVRQQFAALDQARADKAASISAEGLGTANPLVNPHNLYSS